MTNYELLGLLVHINVRYLVSKKQNKVVLWHMWLFAYGAGK